MLLNPSSCCTKPLVLGIYACTFMTRVCFAENVEQSPRGINSYYAAVYGDDEFGGQELGGVVELQRLMPRDALPVLRLASPAARKTRLFMRVLLGHRGSDDDNECDSEDCSLTTQTCCGDGCMPIGAECCSSSSSNDDDDEDDDLYCEQGSRCGIFNDQVKCCRDSTCSSEKEAEKEEEESRMTTRLTTQVSGSMATIITPNPPAVTISASLIFVTSPPTVTLTTPALIPSVTPNESITSPLITGVVPLTSTSRATITTTTTTTSSEAATGSISSSTGGGDAAAVAGAVATSLANRRVDLSLRIEGGMMLGLMGGFVYAFF